jgi:putative inorganic carbon (HCO3(-)) transporter
MTSATYDWGVRTANEGENDYPIAFWCLVFFTFIVYVAPQNAVPALQALYPGKFTMAVAILAYVGQRLSKGASILPAGKEFRLLGLFFFLGVCSVPLSMWPGGSVEVMSDLFVKSMVVCVLTAQLLTSVKRFRQMLWCVLLFGLATAIIGLLEYQKGHVVEGYRLNGTWAGISGNPNDFSLTLNLIIPFAVALYMLTTRMVHRVIIMGFLVFAVLGILLTYSRSGFLTLATIVGLAMLKFTSGGSRQKFVVPILLLGIAFIAFAPEGYGTRIESIFDSSKDQVGSSQVRVDAMRYSLQSMAEHPLFGVGLGMNILGIKDLGMGWQHVHNVYLQIGTEMGVPAMIVFVMFLLNVFGAVRTVEKQAKRVGEVTDIQVLAIACQISMAAFIVAAFFYPVGYHFYMYYVAGFCLALKQIAATSVETVPVEEPQNPYARWA